METNKKMLSFDIAVDLHVGAKKFETFFCGATKNKMGFHSHF